MLLLKLLLLGLFLFGKEKIINFKKCKKILAIKNYNFLTAKRLLDFLFYMIK